MRRAIQGEADDQCPGNGKAKKLEVAIAVARRFPSPRVCLSQDRRRKASYSL
jgi:hypothetical protein